MSAEPAAPPETFAGFPAIREYILARTGRAYKVNDPDLPDAANRLGIGAQLLDVLQRGAKAVEAAQRESERWHARELEQRADTRPPPSLEPPDLEYPEGWSTQKPGTQPLPFYHVSRIWEGYETPKYLVKRILAPGELTVLFGKSGHFKSVVAIDLALSVGLGLEYQGLKTRRGGVLYVAGEGHAGIDKRCRAWMLDRGMDATSDQPAMHVTSRGADLLARPEELKATVEEAAKHLGMPIELVVIDTLAANFGAGDENHASEMQLAIVHARMAAPQAACMLVHHTGHGVEARERGSYSLIAAADCRLMASYDESIRTVELAWKKLKDDEMPEPMLFAWRHIPLEWTDDDGEEMKSVVLDRLDPNGVAALKALPKKPKGKNQEAAYRILKTLFAKARKNLQDRGEDPAKACILTEGWRIELKEKGIDRKRYFEVVRDLQARNLIAFEGPHVWLTTSEMQPEVRTHEASEMEQNFGHETDRPNLSEQRPESDDFRTQKTPEKVDSLLVLRTNPDTSELSEDKGNNVSTTDTGRSDSTARDGPPRGGRATSGKGETADLDRLDAAAPSTETQEPEPQREILAPATNPPINPAWPNSATAALETAKALGIPTAGTSLPELRKAIETKLGQ